MRAAEVVVVGAGAAGLALACLLGEQGRQDVVLVEAPPGPARSPERTWSFWQVGAGEWDDAVSARWSTASVHAPDGAARILALAPYEYVTIRSADFLRVVGQRLARTAVERVEATVTGVDGDGTVHGAGLRGRYVFDTRPAPPAAGGRTHLLQHFAGWFLRTASDSFDPSVVALMDFRPAQPAGGVAFGYVLPTSPREALVEYTEFSRSVLTDAAYEQALHDWTARHLGLGSFQVQGTERGAIPMTDAPFPRRIGPRAFRLGAAGGATRPSTGYTFAAAQRQARAVAQALREGREPLPPPAYPARHLRMDSLLLRALDGGQLDGARFFSRLFDRQPAARVLRFLDGQSSLRDELAIMSSSPWRPMMRTLVRG